jgi:D-beta-D-heptose 7-phosphate kinase/D-beta-D-heptose 1-phosphate adenosyltransferase
MTVATIPDFSQARVLVVGDVMLDRYWHGSTSRISPEAPVPVVHVSHEEERPGGAGNVALNLVTLGAKPYLIAATGDDSAADTLETRLTAAGVHCQFQRLRGVPTVTKLRVLSRHQQLIRLDFEAGFPGFDHQAQLNQVAARLPHVGALILSDYEKGALAFSAGLIQLAREAGIPVIVDPKRRDFAAYRGADLITPNQAEFEAVVGHCPDEDTLIARALKLIDHHALGALLITRGEQGMTLIRPGAPELHLPAKAREVYDVTGAGDTVVSTVACGLAAGEALPAAVALANLAAGLVVGKLGTATVSRQELVSATQGHRELDRGLMNEAQLLAAVEIARANRQRIVMTNGCFDLLHAGHVSYLEQARTLGDRLIVAVNDDDSVRRLKGQDRPVNPLERRLAVLAGLSAVDWVVPFIEDTPERLICAVRPDVLVKGGDYRPEQVAGRSCVEGAGGRVIILPFVDGCSTTAIIDSLRAPPTSAQVGCDSSLEARPNHAGKQS